MQRLYVFLLVGLSMALFGCSDDDGGAGGVGAVCPPGYVYAQDPYQAGAPQNQWWAVGSPVAQGVPPGCVPAQNAYNPYQPNQPGVYNPNLPQQPTYNTNTPYHGYCANYANSVMNSMVQQNPATLGSGRYQSTTSAWYDYYYTSCASACAMGGCQ